MTTPETATNTVRAVGGELVNLTTAMSEALVEALERIAEERERLRDVQASVESELIARMDKDAQWTHRLRNGDVEWEIKAPSPTAGTTAYAPEALAEGLARLVAAGEIAAEAASRACKRTVAVEMLVPWDAQPSEVAARLEAALALRIDGRMLGINSAKPGIKAAVSGANALAKVPAAAEVIEQSRIEAAPAPRRLSVKRVADRSAR